ncbi:histidinol-phosphate transaminase [Bacillus sp. 03113]|uniref:histidinol-phosphate transaminase n=1 Tax=Bacillus sp. 03113 TaxID=2578211 RepID=UPI0011446265|nr:histidinol-phosphate transaminase [Bacillus sp. 03113]
MKWKKQLLHLTAYQPGKSTDAVKKEYGLSDIVKLASNENPFGCSKKAKKILESMTESLAIYPDGYASNLRFPLAQSLKVNPDQLIFGNGSDEIILMISRAMLEQGKNTVMPAPTFPQYRHNAVVEGAEIREVPLVDGEHDLNKMLQAIDHETAIVWLCSPNNPTGTYITKEDILSFLRKVPSDVLVVLDEAYYEYVVANDYYDAIDLLNEFSNLIVLRTFSKIYGLASLRVGYGVASSEIIRALEPIREPFNVNTAALLAAEKALEDQEFVRYCREENRKGLEQFYQFCEKNSLTCMPSQTNFVLIDFNTDGNEVFQYLLEKGYIVRSGQALGFPTSVRVTVGSQSQNEGIIKIMTEFLNEKAVVLKA